MKELTARIKNKKQLSQGEIARTISIWENANSWGNLYISPKSQVTKLRTSETLMETKQNPLCYYYTKISAIWQKRDQKKSFQNNGNNGNLRELVPVVNTSWFGSYL